MDKPFPNISTLLPRKQQLDFALQEFPRCRVALANRLRVQALPPAQQARRKYLGVVENQKISRLEDLRKVQENLVPERSCIALQNQHARSVAGLQRALGNQLRRKVIIELVHKHRLGIVSVSEFYRLWKNH